MGVNSLPKTVTRQRRGWDLNPGPSAPELTTRLSSHRFSVSLRLSRINAAVRVCDDGRTGRWCVVWTRTATDWRTAKSSAILTAHGHRAASRHARTVSRTPVCSRVTGIIYFASSDRKINGLHSRRQHGFLEGRWRRRCVCLLCPGWWNAWLQWDTPRCAEGCARPGRRLESHWTWLLVWCAQLDPKKTYSPPQTAAKLCALTLFGPGQWIANISRKFFYGTPWVWVWG